MAEVHGVYQVKILLAGPDLQLVRHVYDQLVEVCNHPKSRKNYAYVSSDKWQINMQLMIAPSLHQAVKASQVGMYMVVGTVENITRESWISSFQGQVFVVIIGKIDEETKNVIRNTFSCTVCEVKDLHDRSFYYSIGFTCGLETVIKSHTNEKIRRGVYKYGEVTRPPLPENLLTPLLQEGQTAAASPKFCLDILRGLFCWTNDNGGN